MKKLSHVLLLLFGLESSYETTNAVYQCADSPRVLGEHSHQWLRPIPRRLSDRDPIRGGVSWLVKLAGDCAQIQMCELRSDCTIRSPGNDYLGRPAVAASLKEPVLIVLYIL